MRGAAVKSLRHLLAAIVGLAMTAVPSGAGVIYSSFGPGFAYSSVGPEISGASSPDGLFRLAAGFTSPGNAAVSRIDFAIGQLSGTNGVTVSLWTDAGGSLGSQLGTWDITGLSPVGQPEVNTIIGISGIDLAAGANYFLMAQSLAAGGREVWSDGKVGVTTNVIGDSGSGWSTGFNTRAPAFDLLSAESPVPAVPEPATLSLVAAGMAFAGSVRRRRNKHRA